jgi:hypothetical protein
MLCGYILSFSISEGPVFLGDFYQVDKCILASQAETLLEAIRYRLVKSFFLLDCPPLVERDLNEYAIFGSLNTEISGIENETFGRMLCDYLEAVVIGDVQGFSHRFVDYLADVFSIIGWLALGEINSDERHDGVLFRLGLICAGARMYVKKGIVSIRLRCSEHCLHWSVMTCPWSFVSIWKPLSPSSLPAL